ncbi:MAG: hypothetical protein RBU30_25580, partial [Polyangia bacterium]|nr:hypothetical protein [Polyangia bacterium]
MQTLQLLASLPQSERRAAVECVLAEAHLADMVRFAWHVHHEDQPLRWGWHIDCICDHLEAALNEEIVWLLINVPPGFAKSLLTSVYFPAWVWLRAPWKKFLCSSTTEQVTLRDARRHKDLVTSDWYRSTFLPAWEINRNQKADSSFANTHGGERISLTVRAGMIGLRPDVRVLDDPNDPRKVNTEELQKVNDWLDSTFLKRRSRKTTPLIAIQQRVHEADVTGYLLSRASRPSTVHLVLPNEYVPSRVLSTPVIDRTTGEPWKDRRTEAGELLSIEVQDAETTEHERSGEESVYEAQQQQDPTPKGGVIFRRDMFRRWSHEPKPDREDPYPTYPLPASFDYSIASCDFNNLKAHDSTRNTDYAVVQIWGVLGQDRYLREEIRRKMGVGASISTVTALRDHYPDLAAILIVKAANGPTVIAAARAILGIADEECQPWEYQFVRDWSVQGETKEQRARVVVHIPAAGRVYVPDEQEYGDQEYWLLEVCGFPNRRRDDRVDCFTAAMSFLERNPF